MILIIQNYPQADGVADGRWLFINANNTPRIARIDLTTFKTAEIIEIPNQVETMGLHFKLIIMSTLLHQHVLQFQFLTKM
jgi:nitrous oxide reductase